MIAEGGWYDVNAFPDESLKYKPMEWGNRYRPGADSLLQWGVDTPCRWLGTNGQIGDENAGCWNFAYEGCGMKGCDWAMRRPAGRHAGQVNIAFFDGHAKSMRLDALLINPRTGTYYGDFPTRRGPNGENLEPGNVWDNEP